DNASIATKDGSGVVTLSIGQKHVGDLVGFKAPEDGGADYKIENDPSDSTGKSIKVTSLGFTQVFHNVKRIYADGTYTVPAKKGADTITVADDVKVDAELHGNKIGNHNLLNYQGSGMATL